VADDRFFTEYRLQREQVRAEELELLQSIIEDPGTSVEMRNLANSRKMSIAEAMGFELMTENVLYAKDFGQTVVMMGRDTATVILSGEMNDILAARVADSVSNVTGISFENVVIINR
jgi:stage III sporulation protein AH